MRLVQIVAIAALALLALRLVALTAVDGLDEIAVGSAQAQDATQAPDATQTSEAADGQAPTAEEIEATADAIQNRDARPTGEIEEVRSEIGTPGNSREAILARLGERRDELDKREENLQLREELLEAAEKRLKAQLAKIKEFEKSQKDGGPAAKKGTKDLVIIYETMKPKDAAKIFNALSLEILHQLATSMSPRKMSAILAEMDVKVAERLTVAIAASAANGGVGPSKRTLKKIGG